MPTRRASATLACRVTVMSLAPTQCGPERPVRRGQDECHFRRVNLIKNENDSNGCFCALREDSRTFDRGVVEHFGRGEFTHVKLRETMRAKVIENK